MSTRNPLRYIAPAQKPEPKPVSALSRAQLAGRIAALRGALDDLWGQSDLDGGEAFGCIGRMKIHLLELEAQLHQRDSQAGQPFAAAVTVPVAESRLRQAGTDLAEVVRQIAVDGARAMAVQAQHGAAR